MSSEAAVRAAIPADVAELLRSLRAAGFAAYVVGGAVRDVIAGRSPVDWDLATDATPDALRAHFPNARYENRFGTVGIPTSDGAVREVTTFRVDGPSSDARRPDAIHFIGDLRGDLDRRDFTINAIAFGLGRGEGAAASDPVASGALVDPHGGAADLAANILRAVGDPDARFREDALRMLRAARFAARFNLTIDPLTAAAIRRDASLAASLSGERVGAEIEGILAAAHPAVGVALLRELGLLAVIAPALHAAWSAEVPARIEAIGAPGSAGAPDPLGRLWALLSPISSDDEAAEILAAWRRPRATIAAVRALRRIDAMLAAALGGSDGEALADQPAATDLRISAAEESGDPHDAARQMRRRIAAKVKPNGGAATLLAALEAADAAGAPALPADLAIGGDELLRELGGAPGPWLQPLLEALLREAARGAVQNSPAALIARARALNRA
jgi:tRNA nucleotidyltransferase/poly(A) polymerase